MMVTVVAELMTEVGGRRENWNGGGNTGGLGGWAPAKAHSVNLPEHSEITQQSWSSVAPGCTRLLRQNTRGETAPIFCLTLFPLWNVSLKTGWTICRKTNNSAKIVTDMVIWVAIWMITVWLSMFCLQTRPSSAAINPKDSLESEL